MVQYTSRYISVFRCTGSYRYFRCTDLNFIFILISNTVSTKLSLILDFKSTNFKIEPARCINKFSIDFRLSSLPPQTYINFTRISFESIGGIQMRRLAIIRLLDALGNNIDYCFEVENRRINLKRIRKRASNERAFRL